MKDTIINILKFLLFVGVGLGILYLVYQNQNTKYIEECTMKGNPIEQCSLLDKVINDFRGVNYWWVLVVLACYMFSNISRTIRWNMLLKPLGCTPKFANSFLTTMLGYFANLGFPRLGEVLRPATFSRYEKLPLEKVMGTTVLDRILDVVSILLVTALALALEYDRIWNYFSTNFALGEKLEGLVQSNAFKGIILLGIVGLIAIFFFRKKLAQQALFIKIKKIVLGFGEGILSISKLEKPFWFIFHSVNIWLMYFLMSWLCFFAFEPTAHLPAVAGLMAFVFGAWGIVIPAPGGMGSYHFLVIAALSLYGISGDDAFSLANISFFSINLGCNVLFGLIAIILLPIINKDYQAVLHEPTIHK